MARKKKAGRKKATDLQELTPGLVRERYEKGVDSIRSKLQDYWLNDGFVRGEQWIWYNPETHNLDEYPREGDRVQATLNRMWPNMRTLTSKAGERDLTFEVIPTGGDDATVRGARTSESILRSVRGATSHDWESLRERFTQMVLKGGTAAICVDWDSTIGNPVANVDAIDAATPAIRTGDTVEEALSAAEAIFQPGVKNGAKGAYWIKARALPPEEVHARYDMEEQPPSDVTSNANEVQRRLINNSDDENAELTLVLTYYERPNPMRPEGAVAVVVDGQFVDGPKDWPFPWDDRLNIAVGVETVDEHSTYGLSILSDARHIQVALNAAWSSVIEHVKLASNSRLAVSSMNIDLIDELTDLPGEIIPYAEGSSPPTYVSPGEVSNTAILAVKELKDALDDAMGVHEVSRGVAPRNIESGLGVSILVEQDSTPVGRLVKETARVFSQVASMVLKLYEDNVTETRTSTIRSSTDIPETVRWTGKDLKGQTTAIVPGEALVPRNRAAQAAIAEKMTQMGLITSVEQFTLFADMPDQQSLIDAINPHAARARRENHSFAVGQQPITKEYDDHEIHIKEHTRFLLSPLFDELNEDMQKFILDHMKGHEVLAHEALGRQRGKALVDPLAAAAPTADGAPQLPVEAAAGMPPALPEEMPPGLGAPSPPMDPGMLPEF